MSTQAPATPAPQPESPVKDHLFAAYGELAAAVGEDGCSRSNQKRYIREAIRELWRALAAVDAPVAGTD